MKITRKQIDKVLSKKSLDDMTEHELRIILRAVTNEHYNRGIELDLKEILKLNADCIVTK